MPGITSETATEPTPDAPHPVDVAMAGLRAANERMQELRRLQEASPSAETARDLHLQHYRVQDAQTALQAAKRTPHQWQNV